MGAALPPKVLIVRLGAIGDVVNAQVLANSIKEARPATFVGWVVHELARPLLAGHPSVDRVHVWPRASGWSGLRGVVAELRREGYGLAVDLQRIAKSGALARLSGAPRVLGFDHARCKELAWLWSTERIPAGPPERHMLEWYLEFAAYLGLPRPRELHRFPRDEEAEAWAEQLVRELGSAPVLLQLGASKPGNRWLPTRAGELAAELSRELRAPVCLTGGPGDEDQAAAALAAAGGPQVARDLVGRTGLPELVALARRAQLFVGSDTGPMHIAAAVGTPVVALFGPADPRRTGPFGSGHRVVASPSGRTEDLTVGSVLAAARELLASPQRSQ